MFNDEQTLEIPTVQFSAFSSVTLNRLRRQQVFADTHRRRFNKLSEREKEILAMIASGKTNDEIAARLFRSVHTVRTHRNNIWRQLGITSVVEAVWWGECFELI